MTARANRVTIEPPTDAAVADALRSFVSRVAARYPGELVGAYLFGSRARGDHHPWSDADLLVVFRDGAWTASSRGLDLAEMAFDEVLSHRVDIQPHVVAESRWRAGGTDGFLSHARAEARPIGAAA